MIQNPYYLCLQEDDQDLCAQLFILFLNDRLSSEYIKCARRYRRSRNRLDADYGLYDQSGYQAYRAFFGLIDVEIKLYDGKPYEEAICTLHAQQVEVSSYQGLGAQGEDCRDEYRGIAWDFFTDAFQRQLREKTEYECRAEYCVATGDWSSETALAITAKTKTFYLLKDLSIAVHSPRNKKATYAIYSNGVEYLFKNKADKKPNTPLGQLWQYVAVNHSDRAFGAYLRDF